MKICGSCGSPRVSEEWACSDCNHRPSVIDGFQTFAPALAHEGPGFRPECFAELASVEASNFWFRSRNDLISWALRTYFPNLESFFEIGCGTAFVLRAIRDSFPAAQLSGSEIFVAGLHLATERVPGARLFQMDARMIPFREHFDVIGAFDVVEHIEEDDIVFHQVHQALRRGGGLVMTVPQHPALWSQQDEQSHHVRRYTARALRRKVSTAGFRVVRTTSFVSLLLPLMLASRLRLRKSNNLDVMEALRLPRAFDLAMRPVMRVERALIERGVSFPAGGSLLLVARKS